MTAAEAPPSPETAPPPDSRPADLEVHLPKLLKLGLLAACGLMGAGLLFYALAPPTSATPFSLRTLPALLSAGDPRGLIGAGIVLLLFTPAGRVFASLAYFVKVRDWLYSGLTATVLLSLGAAVALGIV